MTLHTFLWRVAIKQDKPAGNRPLLLMTGFAGDLLVTSVQRKSRSAVIEPSRFPARRVMTGSAIRSAAQCCELGCMDIVVT
jgi:hypothetical protein